MAITSTEEVTDVLREHIMSGHIRPGQKLQQIPLSEALGVSRTPLRTALANLANEGLLQYESNRGYTVREFSLEDVSAAYVARSVLEGQAAAITARTGLPAQRIEMLESWLETGDRLLAKVSLDPRDIDPYRDMNVRFHDALLDAAANRWISDFVRQTQNIPFASNRLIIWLDHDIMVRSHDDHHRVLRAIAARDATRAEAIMREHVQFAGEYLCECVKRGDLPAGIGHSPAGSDTIVSAGETSALTGVRAEKQKPREQA